MREEYQKIFKKNGQFLQQHISLRKFLLTILVEKDVLSSVERKRIEASGGIQEDKVKFLLDIVSTEKSDSDFPKFCDALREDKQAFIAKELEDAENRQCKAAAGPTTTVVPSLPAAVAEPTAPVPFIPAAVVVPTAPAVPCPAAAGTPTAAGRNSAGAVGTTPVVPGADSRDKTADEGTCIMWKKRMRKRQKQFLQMLDADSIMFLEILYSYEVIDKDLKEAIMAKETSYEKVTKLLSHMERRPVQDFINFRTALKQSNQEHVLELFDQQLDT